MPLRAKRRDCWTERTAEQRACRTARLPNGAAARRRTCQAAQAAFGRGTRNIESNPVTEVSPRKGRAPVTKPGHAQQTARSAHAPLGSRAVRQPRRLAVA